MRLIDADLFEKEIKAVAQGQATSLMPDMVELSVETIVETLDEVPTAYDVDKVIAQLDEKIARLDSRQQICYEVGDFKTGDKMADKMAAFIESKNIVKREVKK